MEQQQTQTRHAARLGGWWGALVLLAGLLLGACPAPFCGDKAVNANEACDDGNNQDNDGCNSDCSLSAATQVLAGVDHTCALTSTGTVRCWGPGNGGVLGYVNQNNIGDDEAPALAGDVNVGGPVLQLDAGGAFTCALLETGALRCWGGGIGGPLGYGNQNNIGDDESPNDAGDVPVGGSVVQFSTGSDHACAVLDTGSVRCWGVGQSGRLGYGNQNNIGDDETPADVGDVNVGASVVQVSAGRVHSCAVLDTGNVRCWGQNLSGQLGYGNTLTIGDNETPADVGDVNVGASVVQIAVGGGHSCALLDTGNVRCWGSSNLGELGYGNTNNIGNDEAPALAGDVPIGGTVTQLSLGDFHTCALLDTGAVRCWGLNDVGQLGYGNTDTIGDDETPASIGDVPLGARALQISAGDKHTCALLETGALRCWGENQFGQLGQANTDTLGDNETPALLPDIVLF